MVRLRNSLSETFGTQQYTRWSSAIERWWNVHTLMPVFEYDSLLQLLQNHAATFPLLTHEVEIRTSTLEYTSLIGLLSHAINIARVPLLGRPFIE